MSDPLMLTFNFNPNYCARPPGILKAVQTVMNIICVGLISSHFKGNPDDKFLLLIEREHLFFFSMSVTFLIGTMVILLSCIASKEVADTLTNSIFEFMYHITAAALYFCSSVAVLSVGVKGKNMYSFTINTSLVLAAGAMGLFNTVFYCGSVILVFKITAY